MDTENLYEIPCLERVYVKDRLDGREVDVWCPARNVREEDALVDPGRLRIDGTLWGEWRNPETDRIERKKWPGLPSFVWRGSITLPGDDLDRAEKCPECEAVYLWDIDEGDTVHVFYDGSRGDWDPDWEGFLTDGRVVMGYWMRDDGSMAGEHREWNSKDWKPDWAKEAGDGQED